MAKIMEMTAFVEDILTLEVDSTETRIALKSPEACRELFSQNLRIKVNLNQPLSFPFCNDTPPMTPNLDRYAVTVYLKPGVSMQKFVRYFEGQSTMVEVIRQDMGKILKPYITFYLKVDDAFARQIHKKVTVEGEGYVTSNYYLLR